MNIIDTQVIRVVVDSDPAKVQLADLSKSFTNFAMSVVRDVGLITGSIFGKLTDSLNRLQGFFSVMTVSVGNMAAARKEFEYIFQSADKLGVKVESLEQNYGKLLSAFPKSAEGMRVARQAFEGLTLASRALHATGADTQWMFYAVTQMASKARVSMEELNRQLAERAPGVIRMVAEELRGKLEKELGRTGVATEVLTNKLIELIRKGVVEPLPFIDALGAALKKNWGDAAMVASLSLDSAINRLHNTWTLFARAVLESGGAKAMADAIQALTDKLRDQQFMNTFTDFVKNLADQFERFVKNLDPASVKMFFDKVSEGLQGLMTAVNAARPALEFLFSNFDKLIILWGIMSGASTGALITRSPLGALVGAAAGGSSAAYIAGLMAGGAEQSAYKFGNRSASGTIPGPVPMGDNSPLTFERVPSSYYAKTGDWLGLSNKTGSDKKSALQKTWEKMEAETEALIKKADDPAEAYLKKLERIEVLRSSGQFIGREKEYYEVLESLHLEYNKGSKYLKDYNEMFETFVGLQRSVESPTATTINKFNELHATVEKLKKAGFDVPSKLIQDLEAKYLGEEDSAISKAGKAAEGMMEDLTKAVEGFGRASAKAFADFVTDAKMSFNDLARTIINELIQITMYRGMIEPLMDKLMPKSGTSPLASLGTAAIEFFKGIFTPSGGGASSAGATLLPGFAEILVGHGNAFNRNGLMAFASGGVVGSPTLFKFASGGSWSTGLMGEAGPEAILPLKRTSSGDLGVKAESSSGVQSIRVEMINQGSPQQVVQAKPQIDPEGLVISVITKDLRSGGPLSRTMQSTFNLRR